jgi:hypothetical protein
VSFEDEEDDHYGGENTDNTTSDDRGIRGRSTIRGLRLGREDEPGGPRRSGWIALDIKEEIDEPGPEGVEGVTPESKCSTTMGSQEV